MKVIDNGGGEVGITRELMKLNKGKLEVASNPEIGWDVSYYARCGESDD